MKVLGILCSPRKGGNTEILLQEAMSGAQECGAETELVTVGDKDIKPCDGCLSCAKTGQCHIKDDMAGIYDRILAADGIIWGTPVYFFNVAAQTKIILDRLYAFYTNNKLMNKVGGAISVASDEGHSGVWNLFNAFFAVNHMFSADFIHGFARNKGDIRKDKHAMKASRELGRQMVALVGQQLRHPEKYDTAMYRFVRREYGIDACPAMGRFEN